MVINSVTDKTPQNDNNKETTERYHSTEEVLLETSHESAPSSLPSIFTLAAGTSKNSADFVPLVESNIPVLPGEMDGRNFVTIPPNTAGAFRWSYYDHPRILIENRCTAPIMIRLLIDEGACIAQVFRGISSHYLLLSARPGDYPGGGSGEHLLTISDDPFKKYFPDDFS